MFYFYSGIFDGLVVFFFCCFSFFNNKLSILFLQEKTSTLKINKKERKFMGKYFLKILLL